MLGATWTVGAVGVENVATTYSKSLVREPVVASAMLRGTTQGNAPKGREPMEMKQAQANKLVAKEEIANKKILSTMVVLAYNLVHNKG